MHFPTRTIWGVAILLFACAFSATPAGTNVTYQFVGQCQDCVQGQVVPGTGLLTLQNYTLGTALSNANFVSFTYSSPKMSMSIAPGDLAGGGLTGSLPAGLPAVAQVNIGISGGPALSTQPGFWCAGLAACLADYGSVHVWSVYSAPAPTPTGAVGAPALTDTMFLTLAAALAVMGGIFVKRRASSSL